VEEVLRTYPALQVGSGSALADVYFLRTAEGSLVLEVATEPAAPRYGTAAVGTVLLLRVVAPGIDPDQSLAGTDYFAGRCL
jgi:hypothetical protein